MTVVFERPYQFVPPIRSTSWPWVIQRLRLYDVYLRKKEGVVAHDLRGLEHLQSSADQGHGILLTPNHCRYADPLVMGWPARELGLHVHAMASWHLFNESRFDQFALRRMGAFSVFREGSDRQSLEAAIDILVDGRRPLVIFPEGTTNRTNDQLKPLLDGVSFIARAAAKRRAKLDDSAPHRGSGKVVVHPVALKYLCQEPINDWATRQLDQFESHLGWRLMPRRDIRERTVLLAEALLALKETQYMGGSQTGELPERRDRLIQHLLERTESEMQLQSNGEDIRERVRQIRSTASSRYFEIAPDSKLLQEMRRHVVAADLAQELVSYPDSYLLADQVTDTRIVETVQRMQEATYGKADHTIPLKVVIEFAPAIEVKTKRPPRGERDPLMVKLESELQQRVNRLSNEARRLTD